MIHTMVLCAGLGQRLRPLTDELPKPLMPVGDRSVLAHIARRLRAAGRSRAVVNTHWLHGKFSRHIDDLDFTFTLVHEPVLRGVAGGVAGARHLLEAPVLVWNGDVLVADPPMDALVARVEQTGGICLAVAPSRGSGTVGLDALGRIVRVRGEAHGREVREADYVPVFALGRDALRELPEHGCLIGDYILPRLRRGEPIDTCLAAGPWWDVGTPVSYLQANLDWLEGNTNAPGGSHVAAGVAIPPGVSLASSVVGAGARLEGSGPIIDCVVWPGSVAIAPLSRCVVTPRSVVHVDVGVAA